MSSVAEQPESSDFYCLRSTAIPKAPERLGIEQHWCLTDSKKAYKRRRHPSFESTSITYALNRHGYRCPEFDTASTADPSCFRLVVIGGSETFGIGLPISNVYVSLLASRIEEYIGKKVTVWNLGLPMAGSDYIARMLHPVIKKLSPDFLLLNFPEQLGYREYCNDNNEMFFCEPGALSHRRKIYRFLDPEAARVDRAHVKLESSYQNIANFYNNYCFCEFLCDNHSLNWLFSGPSVESLGMNANSFRQEKRVSNGIYQCIKTSGGTEEQLFARDYIHPGILAHQRYSELVFERFTAGYSSGGTE